MSNDDECLFASDDVLWCWRHLVVALYSCRLLFSCNKAELSLRRYAEATGFGVEDSVVKACWK